LNNSTMPSTTKDVITKRKKALEGLGAKALDFMK
jgi:hypothetical protein